MRESQSKHQTTLCSLGYYVHDDGVVSHLTTSTLVLVIESIDRLAEQLVGIQPSIHPVEFYGLRIYTFPKCMFVLRAI
jgi:hypothetical protein